MTLKANMLRNVGIDLPPWISDDRDVNVDVSITDGHLVLVLTVGVVTLTLNFKLGRIRALIGSLLHED